MEQYGTPWVRSVTNVARDDDFDWLRFEAKTRCVKMDVWENYEMQIRRNTSRWEKCIGWYYFSKEKYMIQYKKMQWEKLMKIVQKKKNHTPKKKKVPIDPLEAWPIFII